MAPSRSRSPIRAGSVPETAEDALHDPVPMRLILPSGKSLGTLQVAAGATSLDLHRAAVENGAVQQLDAVAFILGHQPVLPYPPLTPSALRGMEQLSLMQLPARCILVAVASNHMPCAAVYNSETGVCKQTFPSHHEKVRSAMMSKAAVCL